MATNVYASKETNLTKYGFRWCNKDCRWEARRSMDEEDAAQLAQLVQAKVEVVELGQTTLSVDPNPDQPPITIEA